ncbi:Uncharacterized protein APZ42_010822 [Daphnia magna]|uniref:Uncharacterized protein n=1 Tax=Daphnia magna TaxID=35525 RepID=A0A164D715_9CRUS|nr:Uncharacterized protein APZ42_010822 [Daphnia magna]
MSAIPSAVPFRVASDRGWLLKRTSLLEMLPLIPCILSCIL